MQSRSLSGRRRNTGGFCEIENAAHVITMNTFYGTVIVIGVVLFVVWRLAVGALRFLAKMFL